jgi:hypothetical protein
VRRDLEHFARHRPLRRPKPAEATLGFSSTRKTIDNSPSWRYSSDQKKRLFKFLIQIVPMIPGIAAIRRLTRTSHDGYRVPATVLQ